MGKRLEPLERTITEHMQGARDAAGRQFQGSALGRQMSERAQQSLKAKLATTPTTALEPWEKEVVAQLEKVDKGK